jgi:thioesterase domain-containing protein
VPIALFKAREKGPDLDETPAGLTVLSALAGWGWQRFALGSVAVVAVAGTHLSMLAEPHVGTLAGPLDAALQQAHTALRLSAAGSRG